VSEAIRLLESRLGTVEPVDVDLFHRHGRGDQNQEPGVALAVARGATGDEHRGTVQHGSMCDRRFGLDR